MKAKEKLVGKKIEVRSQEYKEALIMLTKIYDQKPLERNIIDSIILKPDIIYFFICYEKYWHIMETDSMSNLDKAMPQITFDDLKQIYDEANKEKPAIGTPEVPFNPFESKFDKASTDYIANSAITTASKILISAAIMCGSFNYLQGLVQYPNGENWILKFYREKSGEPNAMNESEMPALQKLILFLHAEFKKELPLADIIANVREKFKVEHTRHERKGIQDPTQDVVYTFDSLAKMDKLEGAQLLFQLNFKVEEL